MSEKEHTTLSFDFCIERFRDAFFAKDDVGAVIRCHFEAERASIHVLSALTKGRFKARDRTVRYLSQKLEILRLVGVDPKQLKPLEIHNSHRNKFVHDGQEALNKLQLAELHQSVLDVRPDFGEYEFSFPDAEFKSRYADLTDRQKYVVNVMMAVVLLAAIPDVLASLAKKA